MTRFIFLESATTEVWSSTDGGTWSLVKPNTFLDKDFDPTSDWEGRHTAGYVVYKSKMWIISGDANQGHIHNDVWNSADGKTWSYVNKSRDVPWGPRVLHYTLVFKDKIWGHWRADHAGLRTPTERSFLPRRLDHD